MKLLIIDNILENLEQITTEGKKLKLYDNKSFNKKFNVNQHWPGERSQILHEANLPLFKYIWNICEQNLKGFLEPRNVSVEMYFHQRDKKYNKQEWIHTDKDVCDYIGLIYLSQTNFKSGTMFFNNTNQTIQDVKFVKNRGLFFDARYKHKGYGLHNGRFNITISIKYC